MKYFSSLVAALILAGCATDSGTTTSSDTWTCQYCHNVEIHQTGTGMWFDFPNKDGVHYVTEAPKSKGATITATFTITGTGKIVSEGGGTPQVRLYFQSCPDMSGIGDAEYCRWWSNPNAVRLTPEILKLKTFKLTAKLVPGMWSSVYGKFGDENPVMFEAAKDDMGVAGITFGSDITGFGHGCHAASGSLKFTLTSFTIK